MGRVALRELGGLDQDLLVAGLGAAVAHHHVAGLRRLALRLLALAGDHRDHDLAGLGRARVDGPGLARRADPAVEFGPGEQGLDVDLGGVSADQGGHGQEGSAAHHGFNCSDGTDAARGIGRSTTIGPSAVPSSGVAPSARPLCAAT